MKLLIEALKCKESPELALDAAWALNEMARKNVLLCGWIREAGGQQALQESLVVYSQHREHVDCCMWLLLMVAGPMGLLQLLRLEQLPQEVVLAVLQVMRKELKRAGFLHFYVELEDMRAYCEVLWVGYGYRL